MIEVLHAPFASVTDLGRFDGPSIGLSVNGALDQLSARIANILVGNDDGAPLIEMTATGMSMVSDVPLLIAVTGASTTLTVDGFRMPSSAPASVAAGQRVTVTMTGRGLRAYLAIRGGLDVPSLLGSCAPDSMIGFGLRLGDGVVLDERVESDPLRNPYLGGALFRFDPPSTGAGPDALVDVTDGPDVAEFAATAGRLFEERYVVGVRSNHVGLRLSGQTPRRSSSAEVLSRGVPVGAVEVPSERELLLLHRGRGVTAGYPVLAVLTGLALDRMAQARPGDGVRFRLVDVDEAHEAYLARHLAVGRFRERCWNALSENGVERFGLGTLAHDDLSPTR